MAKNTEPSNARKSQVSFLTILALLTVSLIGIEVNRRRAPDAYEKIPAHGRSAANMRAIFRALHAYGDVYRSLPEPPSKWSELLSSYPWISGTWAFQHPNMTDGAPVYDYIPDFASNVVVLESAKVREMIGGGQLGLMRDGNVRLLSPEEVREIRRQYELFPSMRSK